MNTKTRSYEQHAVRFGFTGILQGHYVAEKVYSFVQKVENAMDATKSLVKAWMKNSAGRKELARLNDRELHDIGLTRADVYNELRKPFWRS